MLINIITHNVLPNAYVLSNLNFMTLKQIEIKFSWGRLFLMVVFLYKFDWKVAIETNIS
jgi:hypothetical protein